MRVPVPARLLLAAIACLVVAACGGDSGDDTGGAAATTTTAASGTTAAASQACADAAALKAIEPAGIHWFEEPLNHTDFDGYAALRANAGVSLAMGEREFDLVPLRELARRNALDLWQPDIMRLGGVEGWLESAALARAHHLPVLPHYDKEYDAALCCTIPDAYGVESFDRVDGLIDRPLRIENGRAYPADAPGWGFSFKPGALAELRL